MDAARVLIVDDLPFMRKVIRDVLLGAGFVIAGEAENGQEGIFRYAEKRPDIVLLDIAMPVLDGITALEKIIRFDPRARVIMCSALGQQDLIVRAIQLGARDFVVKPFHAERIISAITKTLKN